MVKMKGQIFILASVMILIALVLLQNAIRPFEAVPKNYLRDNFQNVRNEIVRTVDIALLNGDDISTDVDSFIGFSRDVMTSRGYTESVDYSISTFGNTTEILVNLTLSQDNSFIQDGFIINRTVVS
jgi:hypothetical protein